jgi:hypothetical protein
MAGDRPAQAQVSDCCHNRLKYFVFFALGESYPLK